jgi:polysaccharide pyruvyl transferase CsaB
MRTVLLSGYYGFDNAGDEAVLAGLLAGIRQSLPDVRPVVLSGDPTGTSTMHGVETVPRMDMRAVTAALRRADLLISGGGSLLQDVTSWRSPLYYLHIIDQARRLRVPTVFLAQGVGPLQRPLIRWLVRRTLQHVTTMTVRDTDSASLLQEMGVTTPVTVTADAAFLMPTRESARVGNWWNVRVGERPALGVALRPWGGGGGDALPWLSVAEALRSFAEVTEARLVFLPLQPERDLPLAQKVATVIGEQACVLDLGASPWEMAGIVARCDSLLAMRLHALIFAVAAGVPALGLSYDPKVTSFCREAGLPEPAQVAALDVADLAARLRTLWAARVAIRTAMAPRRAALLAAAQRNIDVLATVIPHIQE